ncbi:3-deoxy-manno-octulosonate cytidylyltransferase [Comamonadaceae bacterium M7527]|nr:3-deoxy-manno-octulosonate cytidylyltransferase [Comamonadaceae bacterium M7527]
MAAQDTTASATAKAQTAFCVLIPARLASSRLPNKPLADIHGAPMVVRVAQRAALSTATQVVVAADDVSIVAACEQHAVASVLTAVNHPSGSDRLAQACDLLGLAHDAIVVNVQGDEPLVAPALIDAVAHTLIERPDCVMSTAAHSIHSAAEFSNPNIVKVVLDRAQTAMYFSRAPIAWPRDAKDFQAQAVDMAKPLRHVGIYAYRAGFLRQFPKLAMAPVEVCESLEQLRVLWHGYKIAVHITQGPPSPGVDTPTDLLAVRELWKAL